MRDLVGQQRRHGVADLMELLRTVSLKEVIVRKGLKPCGFSHGQTATLRRIVVNEVVTVLGDVTGHGGEVAPLV